MPRPLTPSDTDHENDPLTIGGAIRASPRREFTLVHRPIGLDRAGPDAVETGHRICDVRTTSSSGVAADTGHGKHVEAGGEPQAVGRFFAQFLGLTSALAAAMAC